jgi:phosphotriesterase-related protein
MASTVDTAKGPVGCDQLGQVLMHEHIFILNPEFVNDYPKQSGFDAEQQIKVAIDELASLKAAGIDTLVDCTVFNLGRHIAYIKRVADAADVNLIVSTGLYTYDVLPPCFANRHHFGGELPLVDMFVSDIVNGIGDSGVKAAVLKCAIDKPGLTPGVEAVLRAVAAAHRETDAPITTHTDAPSQGGLMQQDVFESEGVDLGRVIIGHSGDTTDIGYLERLIERGSYIGMDRFGLEHFVSAEERVATVVEMCNRGYANRMVLSHDAVVFNDQVPAEAKAHSPNYHFRYIPTTVLGQLREGGVPEDDIHLMMVENPSKFFSARA